MSQPKEFFQDNTTRIDGHDDPITYNINAGLLALCHVIEDINERLKRIEAAMAK